MKDHFNREIDYLRISVTDRCNSRCFYCMPEEGIEKKKHDEILRDEDIIEATKAAVKVGVSKIRITGGEPLVRRGIIDLINQLNKIEGIKEITMTTNGTLLKGKVKELKDAGLNRINLSLDTMVPSVYRRITKTRDLIDYHGIIQELMEENMTPIKINAVLLKGLNDNEIGDFIELADKYDLMVRFIELMPIGHLSFDYNQYFISKSEILQKYPQLKIKEKANIAEYYTVPNKRGKIGFINPISHKFCAYCNRIRLTADGKLKPCLHTNEEISIVNLSGTELYQTFKLAIEHKPLSHHVKADAPINRSMNKIGG